MKTITKKIKVDKKWAKKIQKHMDDNKPLDENINERKDKLEKCFSVHFGKVGDINCEGIDVDINVYDSSNGPWIDAILFEDTYEVVVLEPQYVLLGEYEFEYENAKYVVKLTAK